MPKAQHRRKRGASPSGVEDAAHLDVARLDGGVVDARTRRIDTEALAASGDAHADALREGRKRRKKKRNDSTDLICKLPREELEARYLELREVRQTEPERLLVEATAAGAKERGALKKLVADYRQRADSVGRQHAAGEAERLEARLRRAQEDAAAALEAREVELRNEFSRDGGTATGHLEAVVSVFESLTGMRIQMKDWRAGAGAGVVCTAFNAGAKKAARFELTLDEDAAGAAEHEAEAEAEWDFVPGSNAASMLPEYMHDEISFPVSGGPRFLTKVIEALHEQ
jgi:hypothetical protein